MFILPVISGVYFINIPCSQFMWASHINWHFVMLCILIKENYLKNRDQCGRIFLKSESDNHEI